MSLINWILLHKKIWMCIGFGTVLGLGCLISKSHSSETLESTQLFRVVPESEDNWDEAADNKPYEEWERAPHHYIKLLNGDTSYNGGNYVIYYGSEACIHCTGFIFGDQSASDGSLFSGRNKMSDGTWMKAYASTRMDPDLKDKKIKFLMYEDVPDINLTSKGNEYWTLPWATWQKNDYALGRKAGEHIRNDKSARNFRKMFDAAQSKFGEKVAGTPTVIVYKSGVPVVFNQDKLPGLEEKKQDEAISNDLQLKKFIKYYYTQVQ